jgi:hypothetical protein
MFVHQTIPRRKHLKPITKLFLLLLAFTICGCATKRYGRLQPLTSAERSEYTCRDIKLEISKLESFEKQVDEVGSFDGKTVLGFLGDFGIGKGMEKKAALKTAQERKEQLNELVDEKKCDSSLKIRSEGSEDVYGQLKKLKELLDTKIITQEEFDAQKKKILAQ